VKRLGSVLVLVAIVAQLAAPLAEAAPQSVGLGICNSSNPYLRTLWSWMVGFGAFLPDSGQAASTSICNWLGGSLNSPVTGNSDAIRSLLKTVTDGGGAVSLNSSALQTEVEFLGPYVNSQWTLQTLGGVVGYQIINPGPSTSFLIPGDGFWSHTGSGTGLLQVAQLPGYTSYTYQWHEWADQPAIAGPPCTGSSTPPMSMYTWSPAYTTTPTGVIVAGGSWCLDAQFVLANWSIGAVNTSFWVAQRYQDKNGSWVNVVVANGFTQSDAWLGVTPTYAEPPAAWTDVVGKTSSDCENRSVWWCVNPGQAVLQATPTALDTPNATATSVAIATATAASVATATESAADRSVQTAVAAQATAVSAQSTELALMATPVAEVAQSGYDSLTAIAIQSTVLAGQATVEAAQATAIAAQATAVAQGNGLIGGVGTSVAGGVAADATARAATVVAQGTVFAVGTATAQALAIVYANPTASAATATAVALQTGLQGSAGGNVCGDFSSVVGAVYSVYCGVVGLPKAVVAMVASAVIPATSVSDHLTTLQVSMAGRFPAAAVGFVSSCVSGIFSGGSSDLAFDLPGAGLGTFHVDIAPGAFGALTRTLSKIGVAVLLVMYVWSIARRFLGLGGSGDDS
jgi:hypothetical protein